MPVKGRIDMLTTGVRTPVGLKISGSDVAQIEAIGARVESMLSSVAGARSVFYERTGHGYFLDIEWNREALARYDLSVEDAGAAVENASRKLNAPFAPPSANSASKSSHARSVQYRARKQAADQ